MRYANIDLWKQDNDNFIQDILDVLPSGSGFNSKWEFIKKQKNGYFVFETDYSNMSEHGCYDGYTHVKIKIKMDEISDFKFFVSGSKRYTWDKSYFEDTIYYALEALTE